MIENKFYFFGLLNSTNFMFGLLSFCLKTPALFIYDILGLLQLAENLNWSTSQLAENTIGRKLKLAKIEQVDLHSRSLDTVHLLVFGQFQVVLQYSLFTFYIFWCILYSTTGLFNLELWKTKIFTLDCKEWLKKHKKNSISQKIILQALNGTLLHKKKGLNRLTDRILYERVYNIKNWTNIFLFFEEIFSIFWKKV